MELVVAVSSERHRQDTEWQLSIEASCLVRKSIDSGRIEGVFIQGRAQQVTACLVGLQNILFDVTSLDQSGEG